MTDEIREYLQSGTSDPNWRWSGEVSKRRSWLRDALVDEVNRRAGDRTTAALPTSDIVGLTRSKIESMICGFFSKSEREVVLATLERSVVFVTSGLIEHLLREMVWDHSAWSIANLYLTSLGVEPLAAEGAVLGVSEATTCYVGVQYFAQADPFADYLVHEIAHIFHNCKRATLDLPEIRRREWLLDIAFLMRETFAYSCEAYSRILARGNDRKARQRLAAEFNTGNSFPNEVVDLVEVADIVTEAASARNGWKVILGRCGTSRPPVVGRLPVSSCSIRESGGG